MAADSRRSFLLALISSPSVVGAVAAVATEAPQLYRFTFAFPHDLPQKHFANFMQFACDQMAMKICTATDGRRIFYERNSHGNLTSRYLFTLEKHCTDYEAKKTWDKLQRGLTWEMPDAA